METPLPHRISEHWAKHFAASTRWRPPAPGSIRPPGNRRRIRRCAPDGAPRWARSGPHPRGGRKISGVNPSTSATSTTLPFRLTPPSADYDLQGSEPSERRPHHDQPVRTVHSANHPPTPQGKHNPSTTPRGDREISGVNPSTSATSTPGALPAHSFTRRPRRKADASPNGDHTRTRHDRPSEARAAGAALPVRGRRAGQRPLRLAQMMRTARSSA